MSNTATRLITLIMLLQRKSNQKAAELARELDVSVRTLHRYMAMLDEMGIPVYSERGPHGGFSLVRGYKMPPLVFTPEEAVAVYLGTSQVGEMWGKLYQEAARGALAKLDNILPDEQRHEIAWARRSLIATGMHRANHEHFAHILDKLRRAVRERRRVRMVYQTRERPDSTRRDFAPYALVHRWGWWYSVGHCSLRNALRTFRVDRIIKLTLLDETFNIPANFDIHDYLATELHTQSKIDVRMRFLPQAAHLGLSDRLAWDTLEEQPDGSVIVAFSVPDMEWAASAVLSYGALVEALTPKKLRRLVLKKARAVAGLYVDDTK